MPIVRFIEPGPTTRLRCLVKAVLALREEAAAAAVTMEQQQETEGKPPPKTAREGRLAPLVAALEAALAAAPEGSHPPPGEALPEVAVVSEQNHAPADAPPADAAAEAGGAPISGSAQPEDTAEAPASVQHAGVSPEPPAEGAADAPPAAATAEAKGTANLVRMSDLGRLYRLVYGQEYNGKRQLEAVVADLQDVCSLSGDGEISAATQGTESTAMEKVRD